MNYSIFLGPNKRFIPDEKWEEYKSDGKLTLYTLIFRRVRSGDYIPVLVNGTEEIRLGRVMSGAGWGWSAIPEPNHLDKTTDSSGHQLAVRRYSQRGFATRLSAAEYLMRVQGFTDPLGW